MKVETTETRTARGARMRATLLKGALLAGALTMTLSGCSLFGGGGKKTTTSTTANLAQLSWCDQPLIEFQDNASTSQNVLSNWNQVKDQLGFTPYLPPTLPKGSCLVLAGGVIHDPIYGGHLSITYDLPGDQGPVSFSEAPKRPNLDTKLQCSQDTQDKQNVTTICLGVINGTSVTIASRQTQSQVQLLFNSLQANVAWVPSSSAQPTGTPAATTTSAPATATATTGG